MKVSVSFPYCYVRFCTHIRTCFSLHVAIMLSNTYSRLSLGQCSMKKNTYIYIYYIYIVYIYIVYVYIYIIT